jgi:hypothetical protein
MRVLAGTVTAAALALGSACAHARAIYVGPAPVYVAPAPTVVVAPAPGVVVAPAYSRSVVVNPYTGRTCTIEPTGYRWCWTP